MEVADTVLILLTPESGDAVQAMKAGLIEVGDVFVVNKADRPGANLLIRELQLSVELSAAVPLAVRMSEHPRSAAFLPLEEEAEPMHRL